MSDPLRFELTQRFYFEAAHSLLRHETLEADASRRIHGHTYIAEVSLAGRPDPNTGMVVDLAQLRSALGRVRDELDHRFLDEVEGLGAPTLENLCAFLWRALTTEFPTLSRVVVRRDASGDGCSLTAPPV